MTFAFKLSRRLAQNFWSMVAAATLAGCVAERPSEPPVPPPPPPTVSSITVSPDTADLVVAGSVQLVATLKDANGAVITGPTVTWSSDSATIAAVTENGLVTALGPGEAMVTASSQGKSSKGKVRVAPRVGFYVSPTGSSSNSGSYAKPWDMATAVTGAGGRIQPGDTIWLRGGIYRSTYRLTVAGAAGAPVVFRQFPGERAIIDGQGSTATTWFVTGPYTVFWGFEITNTDPNRIFTTSVGTRTNSIANYASHTRYVNLVVHDGGVGIYNESQYSDVEIVGCIWYNIGYQGTDRGHGHGVYIRSNTGPVTARDNIMFNQFGYGIHVFTNPGDGFLNNVRLEGNVAFNNGTQASNSNSSNILMGGDASATGAVLQNNMTYSSPGVSGIDVHVGYSTTKNGTLQLSGNYFVGRSPVIDVGYWSSVMASGDTVVGTSSIVRLRDTATSNHSWTLELFNRDPAATAWAYAGTNYTFPDWRDATGFTSAGVAVPGLPATTRVVIRANPYETGRANIVVYNWEKRSAVTVNLAGTVPLGAPYEIRNVQDLFGTPVVSGVFDGSAVTLPIRAVTPPAPEGMSSARSPATGIDFGVYIVKLR